MSDRDEFIKELEADLQAHKAMIAELIEQSKDSIAFAEKEEVYLGALLLSVEKAQSFIESSEGEG